MLKRIRSARPSHGTVVAYVALFAALATGGAYAAGQIGSDDIARNAVKSKHVDNGTLKVKDLSNAAQGARAYAAVDPGDPEITDESPSRGFTAVTSPQEGVYCLRPSANIDPDKDPAAVSVEWFHSSGNSLAAFWVSPVAECPANRYEVRTVDFSGAETDDVAFGVIVP